MNKVGQVSRAIPQAPRVGVQSAPVSSGPRPAVGGGPWAVPVSHVAPLRAAAPALPSAQVRVARSAFTSAPVVPVAPHAVVPSRQRASDSPE